MKISELFSVAGLSAAVTGGASGIGLAIASALAENGARVTIMDRDADAAAAAVEAIVAAGGEAAAATVDATDPDALRAAFAAVPARFGRLDVLFANAGISGGPGFLTLDRERNEVASIEAIDPNYFDRIVAMNLGSVFKTVQAALPHLKAAGRGRIVVTSSISARRVETFVGTPYVASKAGVEQLVRQMALELARFDITVNALAPGPVASNIAGGRLRDPVAQARFGAFHPLGGRIAVPDDIVGAALFLVSPAAAYITGAEILIDGGITLGTADDRPA